MFQGGFPFQGVIILFLLNAPLRALPLILPARVDISGDNLIVTRQIQTPQYKSIYVKRCKMNKVKRLP
uniref:Putative secreted protein n=1 Tax=Anopheles darlingi TaxID=43151 RepID=A0A2M4DKH4_ANODA